MGLFSLQVTRICHSYCSDQRTEDKGEKGVNLVRARVWWRTPGQGQSLGLDVLLISQPFPQRSLWVRAIAGGLLDKVFSSPSPPVESPG